MQEKLLNMYLLVLLLCFGILVIHTFKKSKSWLQALLIVEQNGFKISVFHSKEQSFNEII